MIRFSILLLLAGCMLACGSSEAQSSTATATVPASELRLTEKGRIAYSAVLTFADGPFAGSYELVKTKDNQGAITFHAAKKRFLERRPQFAGKSSLSALNMTTADGTFGIRNFSRWVTGLPAVAELPAHSHVNPSGNKESTCGTMQLVTNDPEGVIRHVYVRFLDCNPLEITGFGEEWRTSKYTNTRSRPVAGRFTERVRIDDVNTTNDTQEMHETTMTLTFVGAHTEPVE